MSRPTPGGAPRDRLLEQLEHGVHPLVAGLRRGHTELVEDLAVYAHGAPDRRQARSSVLEQLVPALAPCVRPVRDRRDADVEVCEQVVLGSLRPGYAVDDRLQLSEARAGRAE